MNALEEFVWESWFLESGVNVESPMVKGLFYTSFTEQTTLLGGLAEQSGQLEFLWDSLFPGFRSQDISCCLELDNKEIGDL